MSMYELYKGGNITEAMKLQALLGQGDYALSKLGSFPVAKALVSKHFGYGQGCVRAPLLQANIEQLTGPHYDKLAELITMEKSL